MSDNDKPEVGITNVESIVQNIDQKIKKERVKAIQQRLEAKVQTVAKAEEVLWRAKQDLEAEKDIARNELSGFHV